MTHRIFPAALCVLGLAGLFCAEVKAEDRHSYVSKVQGSAKAAAKSRFLVDFKEKWVYSPKVKMWTNSRGEAMSADELLRQGKISLRPVGSTGDQDDKSTVVPSVQLVSTSASPNQRTLKPVSKPRKSPFVYVWDESKENKIRVICTGFGTYHRGVKR
ncbi:MAG: hypothetical protein ACR2OA_15545 [Rubripirellula sp.]|jgi:hypothetical protein